MTNPTVTVSFGRLEGWVLGESLLGTDTTLADYTYEDITAPVLDFNIRRGRQHELDRIEAGVATLTLLNQDGAFTPTNTASPYYPDIRPMAPIKITADFTPFVPPFDPLSITGCVGWYDFSQIGTLWEDTARTDPVDVDTDIIKGVTDLSGSLNHMSEATNGPAYRVNIQNGLSVARFDGTNDHLAITTPLSADTSYIYFVVAVDRSISTTARTLTCAVSNVNGQLFTDTDTHATGYNWFSIDGGSVASNVGGVTATNWNTMVMRVNSAASMDIFGNGGTPTNINPHDVNTTATIQMNLGGASDGTNDGDYDIGEVLIYNSALTAADVNLVGNYLADKWGLTWTDVS